MPIKDIDLASVRVRLESRQRKKRPMGFRVGGRLGLDGGVEAEQINLVDIEAYTKLYLEEGDEAGEGFRTTLSLHLGWMRLYCVCAKRYSTIWTRLAGEQPYDTRSIVPKFAL